MSNTWRKECKGCNRAIDCYMMSWYKNEGIKVYCPCIICILKCACTEDCNQIRDFGRYLKGPLYCAN